MEANYQLHAVATLLPFIQVQYSVGMVTLSLILPAVES